MGEHLLFHHPRLPTYFFAVSAALFIHVATDQSRIWTFQINNCFMSSGASALSMIFRGDQPDYQWNPWLCSFYGIFNVLSSESPHPSWKEPAFSDPEVRFTIRDISIRSQPGNLCSVLDRINKHS
jgi:hypothetical protein